MLELNKTSLLLGLAWVVLSFIAVRTLLMEWLQTMPVVTIAIIIIGPAMLIKALFENILKYDFFNKDYKKK
jgi:CDP-diglyceride synthetase